MLGFAFGGIVMGRFADRVGIVPPLIVGVAAAGLRLRRRGDGAQTCRSFALAHGLLIGIGASAAFGPLIAEVSHWFQRRRGIAVAICASGNYMAGAIWPPLVAASDRDGGLAPGAPDARRRARRHHHPLALTLRRRAPVAAAGTAHIVPEGRAALGLTTNQLTALLMMAGVACCVAMAMPQVHIVAYCSELGYGAAAGAQMLSIMLGARHRQPHRVRLHRRQDRGARDAADRLHAADGALLHVPDGRRALGAVSSSRRLSACSRAASCRATPSWCAMLFRAPTRQGGVRVGIVLMATIVGMALGGWLSGLIST